MILGIWLCSDLQEYLAKAGKKKTIKITAMAIDGSNKKATIKIKLK